MSLFLFFNFIYYVKVQGTKIKYNMNIEWDTMDNFIRQIQNTIQKQALALDRLVHVILPLCKSSIYSEEAAESRSINKQKATKTHTDAKLNKKNNDSISVSISQDTVHSKHRKIRQLNWL